MALVKTNYPLFGNLFDDFFGTANWPIGETKTIRLPTPHFLK